MGVFVPKLLLLAEAGGDNTQSQGLGLVSPRYEVLSMVQGWTPPPQPCSPHSRNRINPKIHPSLPPRFTVWAGNVGGRG